MNQGGLNWALCLMFYAVSLWGLGIRGNTSPHPNPLILHILDLFNPKMYLLNWIALTVLPYFHKVTELGL